MTEIPENPAWKELRFPLFLIIFISLAVYANTLWNGFVYDDNFLVIDNPWIKDAKFLPNIFLNEAWGFIQGQPNGYYRPMMHIIYSLDYRLFGLNPWGFHLINMVFHAGSSALVFLVARTLFSGYKNPSSFFSIPLMTGVLFAVHPIHTEAVTWVSGVQDLSYAFFCLLSLYLYLRSGSRFNTSYYLSVAAFFLGVLCKEPALTLPALLIAYDLLLNKKSLDFSFILKRYALFALIAVTYLGVRFYVLGRSVALLNEFGSYGNLFIIFTTYLRKLILPVDLKVIYVFRPVTSLLEAHAITAVIITAAIIALSYISFKKDKLVFFCLLVIIVPLVPSLYIPAIAGPSMLGERYLYLPSAGFAMLVSLMVSRLASSKGRTIAASVLLVLTVLYSAGTVMRNADWKDEYTLWVDVTKKSPGSADAHNNLGAALIGKGMYDKAQEELNHAVALKPDFAEAHNNLGFTLLQSGMNDKALAEFSRAVALKPGFTAAYINLGLAYGRLGRHNMAVGAFLAALNCDPLAENAYDELGISYSKLGEVDKSIEAFEVALKLDPDYADAHNNLGDVYRKKGDMKMAIEHFQAAVRLEPGNPRFRENLETVLMKAQ